MVERLGLTFGNTAADGELEPLGADLFVPELHGPHDVLRAPHGRNAGAHGNEVLITADLDRLSRADLHAAIALPAHLGVLVVRLHDVLIKDHEVVGANVLAGGLIKRLAAITFVRDHIARHADPSFPPRSGRLRVSTSV